MKIIKIQLGEKKVFATEGGSYVGFPFKVFGKETWVREEPTQEELKHIVLQELTSGKEDREILDLLEIKYSAEEYEYECLFTGKIKKDFKLKRPDGSQAFATVRDFEVEVSYNGN